MKLSLILAPLIAAKVPHNVIMETVLAFETQQTDALEKRRANDRERQNRKRLSRDVTGCHTGSRSRAGGEDSSSKKDITEKEGRKKTAREDLADFESDLAELGADRLEAFVKHRKTKRAALTGYAAQLFRRDCDACGLSLAAAADLALSRGWITVKPEWVAKRSTSPPRSTSLDAAARLIASLELEDERERQNQGHESDFGHDQRIFPAIGH